MNQDAGLVNVFAQDRILQEKYAQVISDRIYIANFLK